MSSSNETNDPETITFSDLALPEALLSALAAVGYESPSPIQAACIPLLVEGHDLIGQAQTGTGKTAAFALPMLARIDPALRAPQVLVLTPTRELAIQVAEAFQKYASQLRGFHILPIYGGQSLGMQLKQLSRGPQVVVGTPGRVIDHLERESLGVDALRMVVLDEADEMLRMGFIDDVDHILQAVPDERQVALFSATMPEPIRRVAHRHLRNPKEVKIASSTATVPAIHQRYWQVSGVHKLDALTRILEVEDDFDAAIVFVRTKTATVELADKLAARGYAAAPLNGDLHQSLRERTVEQLRQGTIDIIVATDVAARGIDVTRVSHVVNYDIPYDTEAYVHRIGRTGRAGRKGCAILFVAPRERRMLRLIERATRQPIEPMSLPTKAALADRRVARFKQEVMDVLEAEELGFFESLIGQMEVEFGTDANSVAAALAWMAQKERPLRIDGADSEEAARPAREQRRDSGSERATMRDSRDGRPRQDYGAPSRLARYRVNVGRNHEVTPRDLVGAIANEAGIESRNIGRIDIFEEYSTVELPEDMSRDVIQVLRRVRVRQVPLGLEPDDGLKPAREGRSSFRDGPAKLGLPRGATGDRPPYRGRNDESRGKRAGGGRSGEWEGRRAGGHDRNAAGGGFKPRATQPERREAGFEAPRRSTGGGFAGKREGGWKSGGQRRDSGAGAPSRPRKSKKAD